MLRFTGRVTLLAVVLIVSGSSARAVQYPGLWSYGWGGWGGAGSTVAGSTAYGMGNFAAGAGAYNEQTAQARSMNANTAMQVNNYMYQVNPRNAENEMVQLSRRAGADQRGGRRTRTSACTTTPTPTTSTPAAP